MAFAVWAGNLEATLSVKPQLDCKLQNIFGELQLKYFRQDGAATLPKTQSSNFEDAGLALPALTRKLADTTAPGTGAAHPFNFVEL